MADITVTVTPSADSINVTVPSTENPSISVVDGSAFNVSVSPNVSLQRLVDLLDVSGTPTESQIIVWNDSEQSFLFQDLAIDSLGEITGDINVTNDDGGFSHLTGYTYSGSAGISFETVLRNILDPEPAAVITLTDGNVSASTPYEVSPIGFTVDTIAFSVVPYTAFDSEGMKVFVNGSGGTYDNVVPVSNNNTAYSIQIGGSNSGIPIQSTSYADFTLQLKGVDENSINSRDIESNILTWKLRPRHLFYGSTTVLAAGASQGDIQSLYDAIRSATSSLATEQLQDNSDSYVYSNTSDKYNLDVANTYAYYFYPSSLGVLTDIKLGGDGGLDIDDAFIEVTNGTPVSITNSLGATNTYYVYRSVNSHAFSSNQSIYFAN